MALSGVGFVVGGEQPDWLASNRYIAFIPAHELGAPVWSCPGEGGAASFLDEHRPRALVLGKAFHDGFLALAQAAHARGVKLLVALCDWHFDDPRIIALSRLADRVIVPNTVMAQAVRNELGLDTTIIEDPYEGPRGAPAFTPRDTVRLLWFGHAANHDTLKAAVAQVGAVPRKLHLTILTNLTDRVPDLLRGLPRLRAALELDIVDWTLQRQLDLTARCDAVLLPSRPGNDKAVRGHNRLVQAIHAGRLALAYPLPAYTELAEYCWCGKDLGQGLTWALRNRADATRRIAAGQAAIDARFAPALVAARWQEEIGKALAA